MRTQYRCIKGIHQTSSLNAIPGIHGVWPNPFGAGPNIVEIEHERDPERLPETVKDQTVGNVILVNIH